MATILDSLLQRIGDTTLRSQVKAEIDHLLKTKRFGLQYERHMPERVTLMGAPVREESMVALRADPSRIGTVLAVCDGKASVKFGVEVESLDVSALVVTKALGDPIFPSMDLVDTVQRGGDKPWNILIEADNYHALQMLIYTHREMVDVIYIDPPYNTKATAWKYNNNYVDGNDTYRHSKWLSFMERRLSLAKKLLKKTGVLIIAIDENEMATLGLLLRDLFPNHAITPITVVHNPRGIQGDNFSMSHETLYFVIPPSESEEPLIAERALPPEDIAPTPLKKWGNDSERTNAPKCFYPIFFAADGTLLGAGDVPPDDVHPKAARIRRDDGSYAYWPIDEDGEEGKWRITRASFDAKAVGKLSLSSLDDDDAKVLITKDTGAYKSVWQHPAYDASSNGKRMVGRFVDTNFPFPKSVYAVLEAIKATTKNNPNAVILDFFAGSGTTLHATALLNSADGGKRQCILVTNNEIGPKDEKKLIKKKVYPGDEAWERLGICQSITWPRVKNSVLGVDGDGKRIEAKQRYRDPMTLDDRNGPKMGDGLQENVAYFRLGYLDPREIARGESFTAINNIFWLTAGGQSAPSPKSAARPTEPWLLRADAGYAVLFEPRRVLAFAKAVPPSVRVVFVVADSPASFARIVAMLDRTRYRTVHIYQSYLDNFSINVSAEEPS